MGDEDKPRRLYPGEIEDVLRDLQPPPSFDKRASELALLNLRKILRDKYLCMVEIRPSGITEYKQLIAVQMQASMLEACNPCGENGAGSISSAITQITMKTIHMVSGESGKLQSGIGVLESQLSVKKEVKEPQMNVHFNKEMTIQDVESLRSSIEQLTIANVIKKVVVGVLGEDNELYWWHNVVTETAPLAVQGELCARFYLDEVLMYEHRLLPTKVKEAMEVSLGGDPSSSDYRFIASPFIANLTLEGTTYCIVDAFYTKKDEKSNNPGELQRYMLHNNLQSGFPITCIKGVPGVKSIVPKQINLSCALKDSRKLYPSEIELVGGGDNLVAIDIDYQYMQKTFFSTISLNYFRKEFGALGLNVVAEIKSPALKDLKVFNDADLRVETFIVRSDGDVTKMLNDNDKKYVYAVTYGVNIKEISRIPIIDITRLSSNDARQMQYYYGVEASCCNHLNLVSTTVESVGSKGINGRHLMLLIDSLFRSDQPAGIGFHGSKARNADFTDVSAIAFATTTLSDAALSRKKAKSGSVITSVLQGSTMPFATKEKRKKMFNRRIQKNAIKRSADTRQVGVWENGDEMSIDYARTEQFFESPISTEDPKVIDKSKERNKPKKVEYNSGDYEEGIEDYYELRFYCTNKEHNSSFMKRINVETASDSSDYDVESRTNLLESENELRSIVSGIVQHDYLITRDFLGIYGEYTVPKKLDYRKFQIIHRDDKITYDPTSLYPVQKENRLRFMFNKQARFLQR